MKRFTVITILLVLASAPLVAATMGSSEGHDLDALWAQAQSQYDLADHDGILLVESQRVTISPEGNRTTRVHRVAWIGSARGIRQYADLRVPYNSANSTLDVVRLRTWRDERWWPNADTVSETAVVETLPYAVALADDYTTMRETMLLHDGVELPCIMETVYDIEVRGVAADGTCGHWVFPQRDAAVRVQLTIQNTGANELKFTSGNGAPEPVVTGDTWTWTMDDVDRIGVPATGDATIFAPYVSWATWPDWRTLGTKITTRFDAAATLGDALTDTIEARVITRPTPASKARAVVSFVNETVRAVHYNCRYWAGSPRPAQRTWETAYGHDLDRAVLAAALFRAAGLDAEPVFRSTGFNALDAGVPGLSRLDHIAVHVSGDMGLDAYYDPSDGTLDAGPGPLAGRVVWHPAGDDPPARYPAGPENNLPSLYDLTITLEPGEENGWAGTGYLHTSGLFSAYGDMSGLGDEAQSYITGVARSVVGGAEVTGFNPETFGPEGLTAGFTLAVKAIEPDDRDRIAMVPGAPAGGIRDRLPGGLHLYDERRDTPVVLQGAMTQRLILRVKTGDREVVHIPGVFELENSAGRYVRKSEQKDGWVTIELVLSLERSKIPPESWPDLRALLLEDADPAGRTVMLE
jgi:hypothetical protein